MEHVSSVRPTGKFPEKVENLKRWARFPGWNFRTEFRVPFTPLGRKNVLRKLLRSPYRRLKVGLFCVSTEFQFVAGVLSEVHEVPTFAPCNAFL